MEINQKIYNKAKSILLKREYKKTCIKAGICFVCGEKIENYEKKVDDYKYKHGIKCSNNKKHFDKYYIQDTYEENE